MGIFRAAPSEAELQAIENQIKARLAEAKAAEKQPPDPTAIPVAWGKSMRRLSEEEVEAVAEYWRGKYAQYDDAEIQRLGEEKLVAALKADGYAVPPKRNEPDRLQLLMRRREAKGN